jgi:hypothetical protein
LFFTFLLLHISCTEGFPCDNYMYVYNVPWLFTPPLFSPILLFSFRIISTGLSTFYKHIQCISSISALLDPLHLSFHPMPDTTCFTFLSLIFKYALIFQGGFAGIFLFIYCTLIIVRLILSITCSFSIALLPCSSTSFSGFC